MPEDNNAQNYGRLGPSPLRSFVGQQASGCSIGYGSVLFLRFGAKNAESNLPDGSGKWSLWSDLILWRIEQNGEVLAGSEDGRERIEEAVRQIDTRTLTAGEIDSDTGDSVLTFSGGLSLRTFLLETKDNPLWFCNYDDSKSVMPGSVTHKQEAE